MKNRKTFRSLVDRLKSNEGFAVKISGFGKARATKLAAWQAPSEATQQKPESFRPYGKARKAPHPLSLLRRVHASTPCRRFAADEPSRLSNLSLLLRRPTRTSDKPYFQNLRGWRVGAWERTPWHTKLAPHSEWEHLPGGECPRTFADRITKTNAEHLQSPGTPLFVSLGTS
jgi:hypothetical protein